MKNLQYKCVDVMKITKDNVRNQMSDGDIKKLIKNLQTYVHPTHIAISVPLDETIGDIKVQEYAKRWTQAIHDVGLNVLFRGTFCAIEGMYDFPRAVGSNRMTAAFWLDKIDKHIRNNPTLFLDGDIFAPLPERTEGIFQDSTSFLPHTPNIQENYANFFNDLYRISRDAFVAIGKSVRTGLTAQNWSEVNSGWLYNSIFQTSGVVSYDHYGITHTVQEMVIDLNKTYDAKQLPLFHQEWSDYWNADMPKQDRIAYLKKMYDAFSQLADEGKLMGFNYWGGWSGNSESIVNDDLTINDYGLLLGEYFGETHTTPEPPEETTNDFYAIVNEEGEQIVTPKNFYLDSITVTTKSSGDIILTDIQDPTKSIKIQKSYWGDMEISFPFFGGLKIKKAKTGQIILRGFFV